MDKQPVTYMLASKRNGTLCIGVTGNLLGRVWQHREHRIEGFTKTHGISQLVWYELHGTMETAIIREKRIKKWNRAWKVRMIEEANPYRNDLWFEIIG